MKRKHLIALCGLVLLSLTSTACSTQHNSSTVSKQSSKTVKVSKSKSKHKAKKNNKKKDQVKKTDKETDKKQQDNAKSEPQKTVTNQSSQQSTKQQAPNQAQNQGNANQHNQQPQQKTQGQINVERGYDPNGAPLLPGQDHAAGSNPDGSPDAWVQGQINWEIRNGYANPDGTLTEKGKQARDEVYANMGDDDEEYPNP